MFVGSKVSNLLTKRFSKLVPNPILLLKFFLNLIALAYEVKTDHEYYLKQIFDFDNYLKHILS